MTDPIVPSTGQKNAKPHVDLECVVRECVFFYLLLKGSRKNLKIFFFRLF